MPRTAYPSEALQDLSLRHIYITKRALQMQSLRTHQAVVDAIRARDSEAARQAMRVHLEDNRRSIEALPDDDS